MSGQMNRWAQKQSTPRGWLRCCCSVWPSLDVMKMKTATKRAARHVNKRHALRLSQGTAYPERQPRRVRLGFGLHAGWCDIDYAIEHGRLRSYRKPVMRGDEGNGGVV